MAENIDAECEPELKPCPFCGGPVKLEKAHQRRHDQFGMRQFWGVVCRNTTNHGGTCCMEQVPSASPEAAIARWNRRAATSTSVETKTAEFDRIKTLEFGGIDASASIGEDGLREPSRNFNDWWNADRFTQTNPFREDSPAYWAWEGWTAALASIGEDAWHAAVLAECMRVESCYKADDPVGTLAALINWHTTEASAVAETIKIHADAYLRLTCGSIGEDGLPPLPKAKCLLPGVYAYTADQMREYARDAIAVDRRAREAIDTLNEPPWGQPDLYSRLNTALTKELELAKEFGKVSEWFTAARGWIDYEAARSGDASPQAAQGVKMWQELVHAADAVVERWHSRDWKQPHTADFINRLAAAVGSAKFAAPPLSSEQQAEKGEQA